MNQLMVIIAAMVIGFSGCEKHDMAARKLHGGSGVWEMDSFIETVYDTDGNLITEGVYENPGRFVFFSSDGRAALSGYRQGLFIQYAQPWDVATSLTWWTNETTVIIRDYFGPYELSKVFTVKNAGGKEQVWEHVTLHPGGPNPFSIQKRILITISRENI